MCGWALWHKAVGSMASLRGGALSQWDTVTSPAGHVFPEFKESDAMFAAERVSSAGGEGAGIAGPTLLSCPLPTNPSVLAFLHFMELETLLGTYCSQLSRGQ